jgi:hypothetical protein
MVWSLGGVFGKGEGEEEEGEEEGEFWRDRFGGMKSERRRDEDCAALRSRRGQIGSRRRD